MLTLLKKNFENPNFIATRFVRFVLAGLIVFLTKANSCRSVLYENFFLFVPNLINVSRFIIKNMARFIPDIRACKGTDYSNERDGCQGIFGKTKFLNLGTHLCAAPSLFIFYISGRWNILCYAFSLICVFFVLLRTGVWVPSYSYMEELSVYPHWNLAVGRRANNWAGL